MEEMAESAPSSESAPGVRSVSKSLRLRVLGIISLMTVIGILTWNFLGKADPEEEFQGALTALQKHDLISVRKSIERLSKNPSYDSHVHFLRGAILLDANQIQPALVELRRARHTPALQKPVQLLIGECLYRTGDLSQAEQVFREVERAHPNNPGAQRWLAAIYYDLGAMDAAIPRLEELSLLQPDDFSPERLLGVIHFDFEKYPRAITALREALNRSAPPEIEQAMRLRLAKALVFEKQFSDALEELQQVPRSPEVLALIGDCHWATNQRKKASQVWTEAYSLEPQSEPVLELGARIYLDQNEPEKAIPLLQRVLVVNPHNANSRYSLAMAYRQLGKTEEYQQEIQQWRDSQKLRTRLSELNVQAMSDLRNAELRDEIADLCEESGKPKLARMWRSAAESCRRFRSAPASSSETGIKPMVDVGKSSPGYDPF
ncbi:MAG: tetratricopeptide repeat protein [Planctomycetaceae bacterium]|mgnify:FL=1|jgi:predicted Zn-dependent protease|nr:tetratricopeptide repeat protein [Planctomycetaceae bacterium]